MHDEILTVKEVADLLKTTRQQVRKMIVNEELPAVKDRAGVEDSIGKYTACFMNENLG